MPFNGYVLTDSAASDRGSIVYAIVGFCGSWLRLWYVFSGTHHKDHVPRGDPKLPSQDTGSPQQDLLNLMKDRVQWRKFIMASDRA